MANKKRKRWSNEESAMLWELSRQKTPSKEIAKKLNKKFGNRRKVSGVDSRLSVIRTRDIGVSFDIDSEEPVYDLSFPQSNKQGWTPEQHKWIYDQRNPENGEPIAYQELAEAFYEEFGVRRSHGAIGQIYSKLNLGKIEIPGISDGILTSSEKVEAAADIRAANIRGERNRITRSGPEEDKSIHDILYEFDKDNLESVFDERSKLIYKLLSEQAKNIARYDVLSQYSESGLAEIMKLSVDERKKVAILLESEENGSRMGHIDILTTPEYGVDKKYASLILPVSLQKAEGMGGLASCLDDAVVHTLFNKELAKKTGITISDKHQYEGRFRDLKKYRVSLKEKASYSELSNLITETLNEEYKNIEVLITQNVPLEGIFLRN